MTTEEEFIGRGQPIEGAFRSMLAAAYPGQTLPADQVTELRNAFFAGACAATFFISKASTESGRYVRLIWIEAEPERFGEELVASLPTDGNA